MIRLLLLCMLSANGAAAPARSQAARQSGAPGVQSVNPSARSSAAVLRRARELRGQHKPEEAESLLSGYLAERAEDADALTLLAQMRREDGNVTEAQSLLVRALNASPNSPEANRTAGKMLLEQKQYPQAMDRFETVLTILPRDREARELELDAVSKLAASAQQAGNPEASLRALEHARGRMPDNPKLLMELGLQQLDLQRLVEAEETLEAARRLAPTDPDVRYAAARVELEQQHMAAAEADLRAYLAARPNDASAHFGLGHVLAMEQREDAARAEFERSVALQPVQTESYYQIGQLDLNAQLDAQAEPLFLRVIARDPKHGGALAGLGVIDFRAKKYTEAEAYLLRAEQAAPEYAPAHYFRGLTLARLGRKPEADDELKLAAQLGHDAGVSKGVGAQQP